jgi:hypothetical protein
MSQNYKLFPNYACKLLKNCLLSLKIINGHDPYCQNKQFYWHVGTQTLNMIERVSAGASSTKIRVKRERFNFCQGYGLRYQISIQPMAGLKVKTIQLFLG